MKTNCTFFKLPAIFLLVIWSQLISAQLVYEQGYFIDKLEDSTSCLIKNVDWKNTPNGFRYKIQEEGDDFWLDSNSVIEFGLDKGKRFELFNVEIDRSIESLQHMGNDQAPLLIKEQLFLEVLVKGKANLYKYEGEGNLRYFYKLDTGQIQQLIYKEYKNKDGRIAQNRSYLFQLFRDLKCDGISMEEIQSVKYDRKDLMELFQAYNRCQGEGSSYIQTKPRRKSINLSPRVGVNQSQLGDGSFFGTQTGIRLSLEAEFILPFNRNKWAIVLEPTYRDFQAEVEWRSSTATIDYTSIEFPLSIRHYFFLGKDSKIFLNAGYVSDLSFDSRITYGTKELDIRSGDNLLGGVGYVYKNRLSLEFRYQSPRNLFRNYTQRAAYYKSYSVVIGYRFF